MFHQVMSPQVSHPFHLIVHFKSLLYPTHSAIPHSTSHLSDTQAKRTTPSQNDCLLILDTPSIPPISPHRSSQILALAHSLSHPSHSPSPLSDTQAKSTNPSQNDCLSILDTPSIPPISPHRSLQILALPHSFSHPSHSPSHLSDSPPKSTTPSQNDCLIILDTPSIPPISPHVP